MDRGKFYRRARIAGIIALVSAVGSFLYNDHKYSNLPEDVLQARRLEGQVGAEDTGKDPIKVAELERLMGIEGVEEGMGTARGYTENGIYAIGVTLVSVGGLLLLKYRMDREEEAKI